jgi:hypothetical protein
VGRGPPYPFPPSMSISPASSVNIRDNVSVNSSTESEISNICQLDGGNSVNNTFNTSDESSSDNGDNDMTEYLTDDEIEPQTEPINISPVTKPNKRQLKILKASSLPLVAVLNARSLYNKNESLKTFMTELGIEAGIISETWERDDQPLDKLLNMNNYKVHSHRRQKVKANRQPGGACALVYNENRFEVTNLDIYVPKGVEACWSVFKPKNKTDMIENIAIASRH